MIIETSRGQLICPDDAYDVIKFYTSELAESKQEETKKDNSSKKTAKKAPKKAE